LDGFLFETHAHVSEVSPCGNMGAAQMVEVYRGQGYRGMIVTDHMHPHGLKRSNSQKWRKRAAYFLNGCRLARAAAVGKGFTVLLGMEIRFLENDNDYLLYGVNEDFVERMEHLDAYPTLKSFRPVAEEHGLLLFQAHPFRKGMTVANPALLDGMEIFNGNPNHNSSNDAAEFWANKYGLRPLSGSDYHGDAGTIFSGVYFEEDIQNERQLVEALRAGRYRL